MKAIGNCPQCGHEIAASEAVESFAGKGWASDFLVVNKMDLKWSIDVEGVEVEFSPQKNTAYVNKQGTTQVKQKAHLHRWKVAEKAAPETAPEVDPKLAAKLASGKATKAELMAALAGFLEK